MTVSHYSFHGDIDFSFFYLLNFISFYFGGSLQWQRMDTKGQGHEWDGKTQKVSKNKIKERWTMACIRTAEEFSYLMRTESLRTDSKRSPFVQTKRMRLKRKRIKHIQ